MATISGYNLLHERSTLATLEADLQNREIGLDFANKTLIGKFNDGTKFHLISQEQTAISLAATMTLTGAIIASNAFTLSALTASRPMWTGVGGLVTTNAITGTGTTLVTNTSPTIVTPILTTPTMTAPVLGVAAATSLTFGGTALSNYDEGTFTLTSTGGDFSISQTGTARYTRVGKIVMLYLPELYGTSTSTTFSATGLPAALNPSRIQNFPLPVITDNSAVALGAAYISLAVSGTISFFRGTAGTWTGSNLKGSGSGGSIGTTITYTLQ